MMKMKCLPMMVLTLAVILVMFSSKSEARKRKAGRVCGLTCYREGIVALMNIFTGGRGVKEFWLHSPVLENRE